MRNEGDSVDMSSNEHVSAYVGRISSYILIALCYVYMELEALALRCQFAFRSP